MIKQGSSGEKIWHIQNFLKSLGYKIISVNNKFDNSTLLAVIEYQKDKKLLPDGIIGPKTLSQMIKDGLKLPEDKVVSNSRNLSNEFIKKLTINCEKFEGLIELKRNASWDDPAIEGWQKQLSDNLSEYMLKIKYWTLGQPYCAAFVGATVLMSLEQCNLPTEKFIKNWTAHVMTNVRYLKSNNILSITPSLGSIWLAKFGSTDSGHTGVVIDIKGDNLETIEGNTMSGPSKNQQAQRNGDGIFRRKFHKSGRGTLKTQGFLSSENLLKFFTS